MVNFTLNGNIRKDLGSSNTNRLKKEGYTPAVVYGENGKENLYVSVSKKDFDKEYLKGGVETKTIELVLEGKKYNVIAYQLDIDPISDLPRHIDFVSLEGKKEVKTLVPVKYVGKEKSPGLKKNGFLNVIKRKLLLYVDPKAIPSEIEVDVSGLHIGANIRILDLKLPNGVRPVTKDNYPVVSVTGRGKSDDGKPTENAAAPDAKADAKATPAKEEKKPAEKK